VAQNRILNSQPVALSATLTTNIFNTAITSLAGPIGYTQTQPYAIIRRIKVTNKTAGAATFSLWKGASAGNVAGTELYNGQNVPANSSFIDYCILRMDSGDFLVGGASAGATLTIELEGEMGLSG
jgi:hypothetical protein